MAFVKVQKNKAYFKRFQTQFRRRREGKTNYHARKKMITQDKDRYDTPKYRLVVRSTCGKIICQIISATIKGDKVMCQAQSSEFKQYGFTTGLKNYSAAYATGLLLGKRLLKQLKMDEYYPGNDKINGEKYDVSENVNEERRPFKAFLDIGLTRATIGNRVFGALKGATDAGVFIPHDIQKFPGYYKEEDETEGSYNAEAHRDRIFGVHIDNYMKELKESNVEGYNKQFSDWDKQLKKLNVKTVEEAYAFLHKKIKENPEYKKKKPLDKPKREKQLKFKNKKKTLKQRKADVQKKIKIALGQAKKAQKSKK